MRKGGKSKIRRPVRPASKKKRKAPGGVKFLPSRSSVSLRRKKRPAPKKRRIKSTNAERARRYYRAFLGHQAEEIEQKQGIAAMIAAWKQEKKERKQKIQAKVRKKAKKIIAASRFLSFIEREPERVRVAAPRARFQTLSLGKIYKKGKYHGWVELTRGGRRIKIYHGWTRGRRALGRVVAARRTRGVADKLGLSYSEASRRLASIRKSAVKEKRDYLKSREFLNLPKGIQEKIRRRLRHSGEKAVRRYLADLGVQDT